MLRKTHFAYRENDAPPNIERLADVFRSADAYVCVVRRASQSFV